MIAAPPIDLNEAWERHVATVLSDRDDEHRIHGSDLHSCDFALWQRLHGVEQIPNDDGAFANFERGHAYENRVHDAILAYAIPLGYVVTRGREVDEDGIVGHLDFVLEKDGKPVAVIDATTTASKSTAWSYGHTLKSAFYAVAIGADTFCEWVFSIGFGGKINAHEPHWFSLDDEFLDMTWRDIVFTERDLAKAVAARTTAPPASPPIDPLTGEAEAWRCNKGYCRARCDYNVRFKPL